MSWSGGPKTRLEDVTFSTSSQGKSKAADIVSVQPLLREIFTGLSFGLFIGLILTGPIIYALFRVHFMRKAYRAAAKDPFKELPLRPAGESLRVKIDELADEQQTYLFTHVFAAVGALIMLLACPVQLRLWVIVGFLVAMIIDAFTGVPKILRVTKQLWNARLGYTGERAVAEELNQLLACGYRVFHDLPFDNFNIDHVVVGPKGLFAVETKTRRKPVQDGKNPDYKVIFDGQFLHWPNAKEKKSVDQATLNARTLSEWISSSAGEPVSAQAIVAIPGWWVENTAKSAPIWVLNPKGLKAFIEARSQLPLAPTQVQRIAHQLTLRCRLKND